VKSPSILVIRPEKLGDLVVATPVFRAFKESFPQHQIHLLTDEIFADVVRHDPHIDKIITIPWRGSTRGNRPSLLAIRSKLSETKYQRAAILYSGWSEWNLICASLGISEVAQLGGTVAGMLLGHRMVLRSGRFEERHFRDWYLDVADKLGAITSSKDPQIFFQNEEIEAFSRRFPSYASLARKSTLLHLGGSPEGENVSVEKLSEWAPQIATATATSVFVTGTSSEAVQWLKFSSLGIRDELLGKLSLREMMVAVLLAGKVVSNSTGIIHLAAAAGTPTLGIYTSDPGNSQRVWGPLGGHSSCLAPTIEDDAKRLSALASGSRLDLGEVISVDQVNHAISQLPYTEERGVIL